MSKKYPYQLSGGMLQRCMIAAALLQRPDIIIADEPTTALDSMNQREVVSQFHWLRERFGTSLIFVSHDLGVVRQLAQEVLVMKDGVGVGIRIRAIWWTRGPRCPEPSRGRCNVDSPPETPVARGSPCLQELPRIGRFLAEKAAVHPEGRQPFSARRGFRRAHR